MGFVALKKDRAKVPEQPLRGVRKMALSRPSSLGGALLPTRCPTQVSGRVD